MCWHGPYRIRDLLENVVHDDRLRPGDDAGIYVVTCRGWDGTPSVESCVLYVGGNTGKSKRFPTRIGDLLADTFGFFGSETGHHSGGQSLWEWCRQERVNPLDLYIGWRTGVRCGRCAEARAYERLAPKLNKKRPARCKNHGQGRPPT